MGVPIPGFRGFRGYAELCHVWQLQFRPVRVWLSYARPSTFSRDRGRYRANRYEVEARRAVELTRES